MLFDRHYARSYAGGYGEMAEEGSKRFTEFRYSDISATGIRIITDRKLCEKQKLVFKICIQSFNHQRFIFRKGIVVRTHSTGVLNSYGVKFIEVNQLDIIELDEFITNYMGVKNSSIIFNLYHPNF